MKITRFYTEVLGANLRNQQWSWGAVDPMTNRVFLRVWADQIQPIGDGKGVEVLRDAPKNNSNGYAEREKHLVLIENGAEAFGVVCKAVDPLASKRNIASYNKTTLLRFGMLVHANNRKYAVIEGDLPVADIARKQTSQSTLTTDLRSIFKQNVEQTTKEALVNARVGQGKFRQQVLQLWQRQCCVTGSFTKDAIRASHIKPWSESTNEERLDPYNGLPLTANLDALFDAGLISFADSGELLVSSKLNDGERKIFRILDCSLTKAPSIETTKYLAYHRAERFVE
jgi:putative restriction endonuclease